MAEFVELKRPFFQAISLILPFLRHFRHLLLIFP